MITSSARAAPKASSGPIKKLTSSLPTQEAKSPEPSNLNGHGAALSQRVQDVKDRLRKKSVVSAVLLKADGTSEEIQYNSSSKQANQLVNGRPTIVGEFEALGVIVVRSLNQSRGEPNKHILPVPFCNKQFLGNYLLYRVDSQGNAVDLSLQQYEQFVADNKTLTESARKNFDPVDNQEISAKSSFSSNSRLTLIYLRSEVDKKIRTEFKQKNGRNPTNDEVEKSVDDALQALVDELADASSQMNDPDYDPKDDEKSSTDTSVLTNLKKIYLEENGVDLQDSELLGTLRNAKNLAIQDAKVTEDIIDGRDWRLQLKEALNDVRERGRLDGRILANKISDTFYEMNGREASLGELVDVFRRIKCELAYEAEDDLRDAEEEMRDDADPGETIEMSTRIVGQDMVSRARSSFMICKEREPTTDELKDAVQKLALRLAERALANYSVGTASGLVVTGTALTRPSAPVRKPKSSRLGEMKMATSAQESSKLGNAVTYDVSFERTSDKKAKRNFAKALQAFRKRNHREPTVVEMQQLRQFLTVKPQASVIEFELLEVQRKTESMTTAKPVSRTTPTKVLVTPVKKKKTAARYSVYLEDDKAKLDKLRNETLAIKWFKRFNNREPTKLELAGIKQFTSSDNSGLKEVKYDVPVPVKYDVPMDDSKETELDDAEIIKKMKTDMMVTKDRSTKYTLNFDLEEERENGDEIAAMKWFKRFNGRAPGKEEMAKIKEFLKSDRDTIDID